jgi:hypothetical protein
MADFEQKREESNFDHQLFQTLHIMQGKITEDEKKSEDWLKKLNQKGNEGVTFDFNGEPLVFQ